MNHRDWMANSQKVLNEIPTHYTANRENMKVLGLTWFVKEDCLAINSQIKDEQIVSKRTVLRQVASVYDPLGLYSPVTLRGKLFYKVYGTKNCIGTSICQSEIESSGMAFTKI